SFVDYLRSRTNLRVKLVSDNSPLERGVVFVAPDDRHVVLAESRQLRVLNSEPVEGFRPSATVLFRSLAPRGAGCVGVVLSGMGSDGAEGLELMRRAGALTIAQDQRTSAVFGMPRAAADRGAAQLVLPIERIADVLTTAVESKSRGFES